MANLYSVGEREIAILAPAKVNLTLEVLGGRPDGFHEIRSVAQTVNLCDHLHFSLSHSIKISSDTPGWHPEESLVSKAVSLMREATGCTKGATIEVSKSIPLLSGLGGDSSDAAVTLSCLSYLWKSGLSRETLLEMAASLGSDVPLFLYGGTVLLSGRGERVTPLPPFPHVWVLLMVPSVPKGRGKTGELYASLTSEHYTKGEATEKLVSLLKSGKKVTLSQLSGCLFNVFEKVAFSYFEGLKEYRQRFLTAGAEDVHLAGSGTALFTLLGDKSEAERVYLKLKEPGLEVYLTHTLSATGNH